MVVVTTIFNELGVPLLAATEVLLIDSKAQNVNTMARMALVEDLPRKKFYALAFQTSRMSLPDGRISGFTSPSFASALRAESTSSSENCR
jgi:hypothetical protein